MPTKNCNIDDVDEKKEDSSWPENGYANHPQNGVNLNDEEDDDDDLFEDNVWNNLSNENHDDNQQNGFHQDNVVDDTEINNNEYILLSQDENAAVNNNNDQRRQYYRHDYQVEWLETNEQLFFGSTAATNDHEPVASQNAEPENEIIESNQNSAITTTTSVINNADNNNQENNDNENEKIDVDTIRNLMANFQLPDNHYPDWARNLPENEWQQNLRQRLSDKK